MLNSPFLATPKICNLSCPSVCPKTAQTYQSSWKFFPWPPISSLPARSFSSHAAVMLLFIVSCDSLIVISRDCRCSWRWCRWCWGWRQQWRRCQSRLCLILKWTGTGRSCGCHFRLVVIALYTAEHTPHTQCTQLYQFNQHVSHDSFGYLHCTLLPNCQ